MYMHSQWQSAPARKQLLSMRMSWKLAPSIRMLVPTSCLLLPQTFETNAMASQGPYEPPSTVRFRANQLSMEPARIRTSRMYREPGPTKMPCRLRAPGFEPLRAVVIPRRVIFRGPKLESPPLPKLMPATTIRAPGAGRKTIFGARLPEAARRVWCGYLPPATCTTWPGRATRYARLKVAHAARFVLHDRASDPFGATKTEADRDAEEVVPAMAVGGVAPMTTRTIAATASRSACLRSLGFATEHSLVGREADVGGVPGS